MSAKSYSRIRKPRHHKALAEEVRPKAKPPTADDDKPKSKSRSWKSYRQNQYLS